MSTATRKLRRSLQREQRRIRRRLDDAVAPNVSGPLLGRADIAYELSERTKGTAHGGMGLIARLVEKVGLAREIDSSLRLLKLHKPYYESDHVLNIAYNALCGGRRLDDIEARRSDRVFLDGLVGPEALKQADFGLDSPCQVPKCRCQMDSRYLT